MNPPRVRVKICGITSVTDALMAVAAGADALGLVFYPASPRAVTVQQAREICAAVPAFVTTTGLFVDPSAEQVDAVLAHVPLSLLQFHGDESADLCEAFTRPYIKALRIAKTGVGDELVGEIGRRVAAYPSACGILFDTFVAGTAGGSGEAFDWTMLAASLPASFRQPLILAGGLHADNVADAICTTRPYAVDVSSGVEREPGIKDSRRLQSFMRAVYADQS